MTIVLGTLIERLGRKTLLLVSQMGMCACALGTLMSVRLNANPGVIVVLLVAFVGMFAVGLGAVPWYVHHHFEDFQRMLETYHPTCCRLILPELVPPYAVGPAASLGTGINWFSAFLIALLFPSAIALRKSQTLNHRFVCSSLKHIALPCYSWIRHLSCVRHHFDRIYHVHIQNGT